MLQYFNVDKVKPLSTLMVIRTLDSTQDPFQPKEDEEEVLEPEVPYLGAIGYTRHIICCELVS